MTSEYEDAINELSDAEVNPEDPGRQHCVPTVPPVEKIKEIAKELAQPWKYGTALHRFAKRHKINIRAVREIKAALDAKKKTIMAAPEEKKK